MKNDCARFTFGVVIPHYNDSQYLEKALLSFCEDESTPDQILIVDDGSTLDELSTVQKIVAAVRTKYDIKIRIHREPINQGVVKTLNKGLFLLETDYVLFRAADDRMGPGYLTQVKKLVYEHPDTAIIAGDIRYYAPGSDDEGPVEKLPLARGIHSPQSLAACLSADSIIHSATVWFKQDKLFAVGGFNEEVDLYHDWWACYQLAFRYGMGYIPMIGAMFCIRQNSVSSTDYQDLDRARRSYHSLLNELDMENAEVQHLFTSSGVLDYFNSLRSEPGHIAKSLAEDEQRSGMSGVISSVLDKYKNTLKAVKGRIYIYGTGNHSRFLYASWAEKGLPSPSGFIVSDVELANEMKTFLDYPVIVLDQLELGSEDLIVLSSKSFEEQMASICVDRFGELYRLSIWNPRLTHLPE